jgi:hypothetical protein
MRLAEVPENVCQLATKGWKMFEKLVKKMKISANW